MAHVRTVRQVVVAVEPREERVEIARLVREAAGAVEDGALPAVLHREQLARDLGQGMAPRHRPILVGRRIIAQRVGQATGLLKVVIVPAQQFGDGVLGEEFRRAAMAVISQAIALTPFSQNSNGSGLAGFDPGATVALEAVDLVVPGQRKGGTRKHALTHENVADRAGRTPATGGEAIRLKPGFFHGHSNRERKLETRTPWPRCYRYPPRCRFNC